MKNNSSSKRWITGACIAGAVLVVAAGCSHNNTNAPAPPLAPVSNSTPAPTAQAPTSITIYKVAQDKNQEKLGDANGLIPVTVSTPHGTSPEQDALAKLAGEQNSPLPRGTKVLAVTTDTTGLATVDFSSEFQKNFAGGDTQEAQVIDSVLQTLGQFPNIENVQFLVDGQKIATLGGTQDLDQPLPVIRQNQEDAKQPVAVSDNSTQ